MNTVLITGAAGGIGTRMRQLLKGTYPKLRLSDQRRVEANELSNRARSADMVTRTRAPSAA